MFFLSNFCLINFFYSTAGVTLNLNSIETKILFARYTDNCL